MRYTMKVNETDYVLNENAEEESFEMRNKLGQLEDIEEKLNIDIPTFFEIMNANEIVVRHDDKLLYIPSCVIRWESVLRGHICVILDESQYSTLYGNYYFKDYGKTWALTREELEK